MPDKIILTRPVLRWLTDPASHGEPQMDMLTFDIVGDWDQIFQGLDLTAYEEVGHSQPSWQVHGVTHYDAAIAVQGAADTITAAADMAVDALLAFVESLELDWVEVKA